jgi:hypothetical protein
MMGWIAKANMQNANAAAKEVYQTAAALAADAVAMYLEILGDGGDGRYSALEEESVTSTNVSSESFKSEMTRKFASNKDSQWMVQFAIGQFGDDYIKGTCVAAAYCDGNFQYVGTYPVLKGNGKGDYTNLTSALSDAISSLNIVSNTGETPDPSEGNIPMESFDPTI